MDHQDLGIGTGQHFNQHLEEISRNSCTGLNAAFILKFANISLQILKWDSPCAAWSVDFVSPKFGVSIAWKQTLTSLVSPSLGGQSLSQGFLSLNGSFFPAQCPEKSKELQDQGNLSCSKSCCPSFRRCWWRQTKFCYCSLVCLNSS